MPPKRKGGKGSVGSEYGCALVSSSTTAPSLSVSTVSSERMPKDDVIHSSFGRQQRYKLGDRVLARNVRGEALPQVGNVVGIPHRAKPTRFKVSLQDMKKESTWVGREDLAPAPPITGISKSRLSALPTSPAVLSAEQETLPCVAATQGDELLKFGAVEPSQNEGGGVVGGSRNSSRSSFVSTVTPSGTNSAECVQRSNQRSQTTPKPANSATSIGSADGRTIARAMSVANSGPTKALSDDNAAQVLAAKTVAARTGKIFTVADMVIVMDKHGHPADGTIVSVDHKSDPPLFKIRFNDRRKKGIWKQATDITPAVGGAPVPPRCSIAVSDAKGFTLGSNSGSVSAVMQKKRWSKNTRSSRKQGADAKAPPAAAVSATEDDNGIAKFNGGSERVSKDRPVGGQGKDARELKLARTTSRRRSSRTAASEAADAMKDAAGSVSRRRMTLSPERKAKRADGSRSSIRSGREGRGVSSEKQRRKQGNASRNSTMTTASGTTTLGTAAMNGNKRPGLMTRGTVADDAQHSLPTETALRATHPTEGIRRRKLIIRQAQKANLQPPAQGGTSEISAASSHAMSHEKRAKIPPLPPTPHQPPRRPLFQPSHPLDESNQKQQQQHRHQELKGRNLLEPLASNDGGDESGVRQGSRVRKAIYSRLCEDELGVVVFGGNENEAESGGERAIDTNPEVPRRFIVNTEAPWGSGAQPLVKVELSLRQTREPLSAERSALAVATFVSDRHRYSGEQLANVLTSDGFLCYCDDGNKVYVLTDSSRSPHTEALERVQETARVRCGVRVDTSLWLVGRRALDEFLDNHARVIRHLLRHRLASGMWSEVGGVYFNGLFCGRQSKRTFNGVRLGISLATSDMAALESGVWELWITVEPSVHRFSPVDWWQLMREKEEKDLPDFSGSKSDNLEERLQVVCLPTLCRGVVYDIQETAFEMDRLQEANSARGYLVGPQSENDMVEYWRQVHLISLPSTNFVFVKVLMGGMEGENVVDSPELLMLAVSEEVLTYPSWCVIRGREEAVEATQAMSGRILDSFADALDAMEGITVEETTFSWQMLATAGNDGIGHPMFTTAKGTEVGRRNEKQVDPTLIPITPGSTTDEVDHLECAQEGGDGAVGERTAAIVSPCGMHETVGMNILQTPWSKTRAFPASGHTFGKDKRRTTTGTSVGDSSDDSRKDALHISTEAGKSSPENTAAAQAAQASMAVIRKSIIRRRGRPPVIEQQRATPVIGKQKDEETMHESDTSSARLCPTPFIIRRGPMEAGGGGGDSLRNDQRSRKRGEEKVNFARVTAADGCDGPKSVAKTSAARAQETPQASRGMAGEVNSGNTAQLPRLVTPSENSTIDNVPDNENPFHSENARTARAEKSTASARGEGRPMSAKGRKRASADRVRLARGKLRGKGETAGDGSVQQTVQEEDRGTFGEKPEMASAAAVASSTSSHSEKIVVTFSATGSLGFGLEEDEMEEGTVVLSGKSPTSAAAVVPDGWRITEVDGQNVQCAGGEKVAMLLRARPVDITFEVPAPLNAVREERTEKMKAPSATSGISRKRGPSKQRPKASRPKKAAKITTVRTAFHVQRTNGTGGEGGTENHVEGAASGGSIGTGAI